MTKSRWPLWRKTMMAGALWLLVVVLVTPGLDAPGLLNTLAFAVGYGTLMTGFWLAMRAKHPPDPTAPREDDDPAR